MIDYIYLSAALIITVAFYVGGILFACFMRKIREEKMSHRASIRPFRGQNSKRNF